MDVIAEQPGDAPAIRTLLLEAFPGEDEANLVDALRSAGHLTLSLVAVEGSRRVGYVGLSPVAIDGIPGGYGIAPLAIHPEFQHRGIGGWLVREGLERIAALGAGYVVVLGDPEYYARFGFRRASEVELGNEYGADESFMVLEVRPGSLPVGGGLVRYGAEFGAWS